MAIDFTQDCRSPALARQLVAFLRLLDNDRTMGQIRSNAAFVPQGAACSLQEETALLTRSFAMTDSGVDLYLFRGVYRADTARNLFLSYQRPMQTIYDGGTEWEMEAAYDYRRRFIPTGFLAEGSRELWLVGHSYGGMLAQCLARIISLTPVGATIPIRVITFGSPRVFDSGGADGFNSRVVHARWYNDNDPVRHLPPRSDEAPTLHAALTRAVSDRYNAFTHTSMGLCLRDSGVIERRADTPELRPIAEASLLTWAAGILDTTSRDHQLQTYEDRLQRSLGLQQPAPFVPRNAPQPPDVRPPAPPPQTDPIVRAAGDAAVVAARARQQEDTETVTAPQFRAIKTNGMWAVVWQGAPVVIAASKSRARFIARRGNALLRDLPNDDLIDLDVALQAVKRMS